MSESQDTTTEQPPEEQATLLFVDDEANILSSLKRLFRPLGYRIFTAESGKEGLEIMEQEKVELVISDMRMPEMSGAQFLEQVRAKWPDVVRILLTGYADITSTIDAINKGQIYRYISKPWEDNDITITVRQAFERKRLEHEKTRLEELTLRQNEELRELNASLEEKVKARTEEIRQTMGFLELSHEKLKKSFITSVKMFSNLMELREGTMGGHSRRVAELARIIAARMNLKDSEINDLMVAALLHDIGKIGLPDSLIRKPFSMLSSEERAEYIKHPVKGQMALMELDQFKGAAELIRVHHERFDGKGYPDGLSGMAVPLAARILAVANEYDALQNGSLTAKPMKAAEAKQYLLEGRGTRYDPLVIDTFLEVVTELEKFTVNREEEMALRSNRIKSGMVLSRDLLTADGIMLLSKGYVLNEAVIDQLQSYERSESKMLTIYVRG
jgi:response regulator RpfG family c-di-GMP phosphodiesterase